MILQKSPQENRTWILIFNKWSVPLITSAKYNYQNTLQFFSFSCKYWIPITSGKIIVLINIANKILKDILVVIFSRCTKGTCHWKKEDIFASKIKNVVQIHCNVIVTKIIIVNLWHWKLFSHVFNFFMSYFHEVWFTIYPFLLSFNPQTSPFAE